MKNTILYQNALNAAQKSLNHGYISSKGIDKYKNLLHKSAGIKNEKGDLYISVNDIIKNLANITPKNDDDINDILEMYMATMNA